MGRTSTDCVHLALALFERYLTAMIDTKPPGPFTLTPPRIIDAAFHQVTTKEPAA